MLNDKPMKEVFRRRTGELIDRISSNGVLELTMSDIRAGVSFHEVQSHDIKYSQEPIQRAGFVFLFHEGRCRLLKARTPLLLSSRVVVDDD